MPELSVIVAYVNEYPQLMFTIRSIAEELTGIDFEIIAVNNYCAEVRQSGREEDKGCGMLVGAAEGNKWLKNLRYENKLSHWQAKNLGVRHAEGQFLWFPDAHIVPSRGILPEMFDFYKHHWKMLNGSVHMPITYQILEWRRLIYGLRAVPEKGHYFYEFEPMPAKGWDKGEKIYKPGNGEIGLFETPVMSTCGCMMHRSIFDQMGGWPEEIGIYGGGEPFFNFSLAVMGMKKWIWNTGSLHHHADHRGYNWNYDGWIRDELIAAYCFGGEELAKKKWSHVNGDHAVKERIWDSVFNKPSIHAHKERIDSHKKMSIEEWVKNWI